MGVDLRAMTFVHYVENMVGVPHLYNKLYHTPVEDYGKPVSLPLCAQVRYVEYDVSYNIEGFTEMFTVAGLVRPARVGRGSTWSLAADAVFDFLKE
jgi:aminoglycoside 3-N-acetyltransferase